MAKIVIRPDGTVEGLYTDMIPLQALGNLNVSRATNVEFDSNRQEWAVTLPNGEEIAHRPSREAALVFERAYCENHLLNGFRVRQEGQI
jgi:hypothetical protein